MGKLRIPYYTVRRGGRGFWEPRPHMRTLGFYSCPVARMARGVGDCRAMERALAVGQAR